MGAMKELSIEIETTKNRLYDVEYLNENGENKQMLIAANGERHAWYIAREMETQVFDIEELPLNPFLAIAGMISRRYQCVRLNRRKRTR